MEQTRRSENRRGVYRKQALLGWMFSILAAALVILVLFGLWLTPVRVAGDTMSPAFLSDQVLLVDRAARFLSAPRRGDVILFDDPQGGGPMLKRIVALPGETVDIVDGAVFIGGCPLDESAYLEPGAAVGDMEATVVPDGSVFVLGDNRALSYDSRNDGVGCIPYDDVLGVVRVRIAPYTALAWYP